LLAALALNFILHRFFVLLSALIAQSLASSITQFQNSVDNAIISACPDVGMKSSVEIECARAQQAESAGLYRRAVKHHVASLHLYQAQLDALPAKEVRKRFVVSEQQRIIVARITELHAHMQLYGSNIKDDPPSDTESEGTSDEDQQNSVVNRGDVSTDSSTTASRRAHARTNNTNGPSLSGLPYNNPVVNDSGGQQQGGSNEQGGMKSDIAARCMSREQLSEVGWNDVIGMESVKTFFRLSVEAPLKMPHLYTGNREIPTSLLMYGPPGVGKTLVVKALAKQCDRSFLPISCADVVSKYFGDSPKYIRAMFEVARECAPCVLFIDEIDALCVSRESSSSQGGGGGGETSKMIAEFLQQMDGVSKDSMKGVLLIGATNLPWDIDAAIRRRFTRKIQVSLPDANDRYKMIEHRLAMNKNDLDHCITPTEMERLARDTEGYSGSDLVSLIKQAYQATMADILTTRYFKVAWDPVSGEKVLVSCGKEEAGARPLSLDQFEDEDYGKIRARAVTYALLHDTMRLCRPTVGRDAIQRYEDWTAKYGGED
jgi:vacuolar protein-sorting-associated protein 4